MMNIMKKILPAIFILLNSCEKDTSPIVNLPDKPDTTSHEFIWETSSIGDLTSRLRDVYAISEDDIWLVGNIEKSDSLGPPFGAAHWTGKNWEIKRLQAQAPTHITYLQPQGVFTFSSNEIWFAESGVFKYDTLSIISYWLNVFPSNPDPILDPGQSIEKLWGSSGTNLYGVGYNGAIAHYDGNQWVKMISNTTAKLFDVYGSRSGNDVWACGYATNYSESILLHYDGLQLNTVWSWQYQQGSSDSTYEGLLRSLWAVDSDSIIIVGGEGVYRQDIHGSSPPRKEDVNLGAFPFCVRGSSPSNIFVVGDNGLVWHYNGASWHSYPELRNPNWVFYSIAVLNNKVVAVGNDYTQGIQTDIILTGNRFP